MGQIVLTVLLVCITAIWGWTFTVVKPAATQYGVLGFLSLRFGIAVIVLTPIAARKATRRTVRIGAVIGVVLAAAYLLQTSGLVHTSPTNSGLITGLFVVFAPLANRAMFGVKPHPVQWAAVVVSVLGLMLLTGAGPERLSVGDLLTLGAALCFGVHIALLDRFAKHHDSAALALVQLAAAAILFTAAWPVMEPIDWPSRSVWAALAVCGLLATAAGFWIQTFVQQRLSAVRTAVVLTMEPVFATFFGYLLAGDRLTPIQITGAVMMVGAVVIAEVGPAIRNRRQ